MKAKSVVTVVLLAFVGVSVAYLVIQESASQPALQGESARTGVARPEFKAPGDVDPLLAETGRQTSHKLIAYYFHRTQRCRTCLTMEAYAKDALREGLSDAFESGEVEWRANLLDPPENIVDGFLVLSDRPGLGHQLNDTVLNDVRIQHN